MQQLSPNNFLQRVHALRRYLDSLADNTPDTTMDPFGAGPKFFSGVVHTH